MRRRHRHMGGGQGARSPEFDLAESDGATPNPLRLDLQLCFGLYSASNLVGRLYRPLLQPLGLTYLQYIALLALWEQAPQTVGDLGQKLGLDSGTLTPLFKRMETAGLVTRNRDPADERRVIIGMTEKARDLREAALSVPGAMFCQLPLPIEDSVALKSLLDRLVEGLRSGDAA